MRESNDRATPLKVASAVMLLVACGAANAQAPSPTPVPAERSPALAEAVATVDKTLADPSKKEALCAFVRARQGVGAAMSNYSAGTTGRNPITRQRQQIDQLGALGAAQGAERQAAEAVDPEFQRAMEILRIADFREGIRVQIALQMLCKPQQ